MVLKLSYYIMGDRAARMRASVPSYVNKIRAEPWLMAIRLAVSLAVGMLKYDYKE